MAGVALKADTRREEAIGRCPRQGSPQSGGHDSRRAAGERVGPACADPHDRPHCQWPATWVHVGSRPSVGARQRSSRVSIAEVFWPFAPIRRRPPRVLSASIRQTGSPPPIAALQRSRCLPRRSRCFRSVLPWQFLGSKELGPHPGSSRPAYFVAAISLPNGSAAFPGSLPPRVPFALTWIGYVHGPEHRGVPAGRLLGGRRPPDIEKPAEESGTVQRLDGGLGLVVSLHLHDAVTRRRLAPSTATTAAYFTMPNCESETLQLLIVSRSQISDVKILSQADLLRAKAARCDGTRRPSGSPT